MKKIYFVCGLLLLPTLMFAQSDRVSIIETFTSSTCPPCNPGNINLESILANGQNDGKAVSLKYQVDWPGAGDPYYTYEGGERRGVYSISGVPTSLLDGQTSLNPGNLTQNDLEAVYAVQPKANITAVYEVNEATKTIELTVDVEMLVNTSPGVRLYMAVFEYKTFNNVESNGETEFEHVMKKMLEGFGGKVMPPMMAGDVYTWNSTYTFQGNYRLPNNSSDMIDHAIEHSVEEFSDLGVAVWVQTLLNREVYQAAYAVPGVVGINESNSTIASAELYPNPASQVTTLAFQTTENQTITIETINAQGQIVASEILEDVASGRTVHNLNTSELTNGMYTVRISSENGLISKRLVVQ